MPPSAVDVKLSGATPLISMPLYADSTFAHVGLFGVVLTFPYTLLPFTLLSVNASGRHCVLLYAEPGGVVVGFGVNAMLAIPE